MKNIKQIEKVLSSSKKWVSDAFYEKSKNISLAGISASVPQEWITIHFKIYPRLPRVIMDKLETTKINELLQRRSVRQFTGDSITFKSFCRVLHTAAGITQENEDVNYSRRSYPSAGARFPLETYILVLHVDGLQEGLYHYNVRDNLLEVLLLEKMDRYILDITGNDNWLLETSFLIFLTGVPDRLRLKYGERGFRYMLIEAGHLAQNICLLAVSEGFGCCTLGGFIESKVISLLDIENVNEYPLYLLAIGKEKK